MDKILILDFGSQYTQLIARKIRELNVFSEIVPFSVKAPEVTRVAPSGLILSGGPGSVELERFPLPDKDIFKLGIPVLGICYGMQVMAKSLGGRILNSKRREYGKVRIYSGDGKSRIFKSIKKDFICWMSHGDEVGRLPRGFKKTAYTDNCSVAAMESKEGLYAVQFHPEVVHTQYGKKILSNFLDLCNCKRKWRLSSFVKESIEDIKVRVGEGRVILGLSGGVDSSVAAILLNKAIGNRLHSVFVNNGLLREGEADKINRIFKKDFNINLHYIDAAERFLGALRGIVDPEEKRKIIGNEFIKVFESIAKKIGGIKYLAQGTLYPDVVESLPAFGGPSAKIKSHHNVGGLPPKMNLKLIEPFRFLFKDEVRKIAKLLKLPDEIVHRHPFPGPGLGVRIIGEITKERLKILRAADTIIIEEIKAQGLYGKVWQVFGVLLPVKSVGVMGDGRSYENTLAIRAVKSVDGMTADWAKLPYSTVGLISNRIINEVKGINRVVYDVSSKPPATIEWE
ncbi:MAG: glutamine-hydrolyzing GMP synthase [Candidatus Kaelpia imicola]|nr:glutamine-hydrolyzing GMP synthase [Candidatus Kaelpia imicola]